MSESEIINFCYGMKELSEETFLPHSQSLKLLDVIYIYILPLLVFFLFIEINYFERHRKATHNPQLERRVCKSSHVSSSKCCLPCKSEPIRI